VLPYQFGNAASQKGLITRTTSGDPSLPNFDIRNDLKNADSVDFLASARNSLGRSAVAVADIRDGFVRGENALRARLPQVRFEYNEDMRIPEVITPDVWSSKIEYLSPASTAKRADLLRSFLKENNDLVGLSDDQADQLDVAADYTNPNGYMSFAHLEQKINGVPVFRGEVKAGFNKDGQIIRVINDLAPGLDYSSLSKDFGDPLNAVKAAAGYIKYDLKPIDTSFNPEASTDIKAVFGNGDWATTAEKMYFPTEPGVAIPSWRVLIWQPIDVYYVIVDAQTGRMLWRKDLTNDQAQSATYQIYRNANSFIGAADNPAPLSPGPLNPTLNTQGAIITRSNVTLIGNEAPYTFNNLGWITDNTNITDGNNVEAGIDRDGTNGVDAPQTGSPNRVFDSTWNPPPGNPGPGDDPLTAQAQRGAVIQMFYVMNRYHDELYRLGFTEQARNYQNDNFGRGGVGGDRISAEGQDSSGVNNANFSIVADGTRGRMQMFLWNGPTPDYDGTGDAEVIIHEVTHGTSQRLHGNAAGLSNNMSAGMGEGWGDFYGYTMLSEPTDPINGVYTTGGYATFSLGGMLSNYYYGIRRFPRAPITFTGGPNNKPHNPFTFKHLNSNCDTTLGTTTTAIDSAFPRNPVVSTSSSSQACDQVHNAGEIWSSALWEVRNRMVARLGWATGTPRVLQVVTDGMKLAPLNPTFLQERDAIIAAASALPLQPEASADVQDVREGFRVRGMGFSASVQSTSPAAVTEAFDVPNALFGSNITVSDSTGDNDGFPEPGESVRISVPVTNTSGAAIANVSVTVVGGGTVNYGTINDGQTVTNQIAYTIPGGSACGSTHNVTITGTSALGAMNPTSFGFRLGQGVFGGNTQNFDGVTAPALPGSWDNVQISGTGINWVTTTSGPSSAPNSAFANDPASLNDAALVTSAKITSASASIAFKNKFTTENTFDGAVLEYSTNGGNSWTDVCPSCASICPGASCPFVSGGYTQTISTGFSSPIGGRRAWSGTQASYVDTVINLPAALNGQTILLRWRMASDVSVSSTGINIDDIVLTGGQLITGFQCSVATSNKTPFDFDGDHKTDISIFRPNASAEWWYSRSSNSQVVAGQFGVSTDIPTPGDFTGDGKTDIAFFRPSTGQWFILRSEDFSFLAFPFGSNGDIPAPADYDNDGKTDAAVFRNGTWFILPSGGGATIIAGFGAAGDKPVPADYDNDGKADLAITRTNGGNKEWWVLRSTAGLLSTVFGVPTDLATPGDYTGDGKADIAFFRPSNGTWFILRSEDLSFLSFPFGAAGDIPVPGDYDGDGKFDPSVFRAASASWFINRSGGAGTLITNFGSATDRPVPNVYVR
jgi:hypothetical protein